MSPGDPAAGDGGRSADPPEGAVPRWAAASVSASGLATALRPFCLRERWGPEDETGTEEAVHDHGNVLLDSRLRPEEYAHSGAPSRSRRSVSLTFLVDTGASMLFQREVADSLVRLTREAGIFRDVEELYFDSGLVGAPVFRASRGTQRAPSQQPVYGSRVALLLTDGVGQAWRDHGFRGWLADLAERSAVAIMHLLAPEQWRRTGIHTVPAELALLRPPFPVCENSRYSAVRRADAPHPEFFPGDEDGPDPDLGTCVPVLSLSTERIHAWAMFAMGRGGGTLRSRVLPVPGKVPDGIGEEQIQGSSADGSEETPERLVRRFVREASPSAFRLAVGLAVVPLHAGLMSAVARHVLGRPGTAELTEVVFGGLVRPITDAVEGGPKWDFLPGTRRELLSLGGRVSRIRSLLRLAADLLDDADPWFPTLRMMLDGAEPEPGRGTGSAMWMAPMRAALEAASIIREDSDLFQILGAEEGTDVSPGAPLSDIEFSRTVPGTQPTPEIIDVFNTSEGGVSMARFDDRSTVEKSGVHGGAHTQGRPPSAVWIQVPRRNPSFVGRRRILSTLREKVLSGSQQVITALNGTSGVGKTELAKEYVYRYAEEYDLICWIPSHQDNLLRRSFAVLAEELGLGYVGAGSDHVVRGVLEALRQGRQFGRWLLVFDNAGDREELNQFLPRAGGGHVIITSRDSSWERGGSDTFLQVEVFTRQESVELLKLRGPKSLTEPEADRLADELGDLPLALNQAAVWLTEVGMDVSDYLDRLSEKTPEMIRLLQPVDPDYPIPVAAAWNVSLDQLAEDNPAALQLLQMCAFMSTAPIPRTLFRFARDMEGPEELRRALSDPVRTGMAIRDVGRYSLAQLDHQRNTLSLHRLVRLAVRASLPEEEQRTFRHCAHQLLSRNDPQGTTPEALRQYTVLLPHVWEAQAWDCRDPWSRELVVKLCDVAIRRREYDEVRALGTTAHEAWAERFGAENRDTLRMALRISQAHRGVGELERARELCESTMHTIGSVSGENSAEYMEADLQHARNLRQAGRFQEALDFTSENYERRVRLFGQEDPETLNAAHFLAFDLMLVGRVTEALERYADTWERKEAVLGPDDSVTIMSVDGYTDALMESGRYRDAANLQRDLVDRALDIFGPDDVAILSLQSTLSTMLRRSGWRQEAYELSEQVLRQLRDRRGEDIDDTIHAALRHSLALYGVQRFGEALELAESAAAGLEKLWGGEHTHVAAAWVNQAIMLRRLDRLQEARALDERAMALFMDRLGADHPSTLSCSINLGNDLFRLGDTAGALERDESAVEACREALGEKHPLTLLARRNLVMGRNAMGSVDPAEIDALETDYQEIMGTDHPVTRTIRDLARGDSDIYIGAL
ncbi:FxSxx-COOH system tetratricopeptide repeat protein [Nocardiopsis sp. LOL_012]|uniref:FxSxx-COOH system tetratricopeptide repeat protein n=1 Tax=Nocardiopsis sp. LOL_012 TaxID=3345409 RepID=UPI003A8AA029